MTRVRCRGQRVVVNVHRAVADLTEGDAEGAGRHASLIRMGPLVVCHVATLSGGPCCVQDAGEGRRHDDAGGVRRHGR